MTQAQIATQQQAQQQGSQLFQASFPGFQTAESYYQQLASGNPQQISAAVGPAVGQINAASQSAVQNIQQNMPRGGAEQLAVANVEQQRAGQIGNLSTQAYTSSFPALASLSQGGIGLSANQIANAISAGSAGSQSNAQLMNAQVQGKGNTLGFLGSLAGGAGTALSGTSF